MAACCLRHIDRFDGTAVEVVDEDIALPPKALQFHLVASRARSTSARRRRVDVAKIASRPRSGTTRATGRPARRTRRESKRFSRLRA
jgi:hypothetical protein